MQTERQNNDQEYILLFFWMICMWSRSKQGTYGAKCDINMLQYTTALKGKQAQQKNECKKKELEKKTCGWLGYNQKLFPAI